MRGLLILLISACVTGADPAAGQSIDAMGVRAAGMAGAFVGVADDASAAFWNPGGLASGAYVSLVLDGGAERAAPDGSLRGRTQSSFFIGATIPALGLTYYRLQRSFAAPYDLLVPPTKAAASRAVAGVLPVRVDSLVTHHAGVTLVQSVFPNVAVGATLKLVRGSAASEPAGFVTAKDALEHERLRAHGSTTFDADLGVMASFGALKAGLAARNVREPDFRLPDGERSLTLERQARAGVSYAVSPNWLVAVDLDLLESHDAFGDRRDLALGVEGRVARRTTIRSGLRLNTASTADDGSGDDRAVAFGASWAATGSVFVDAAAVVGGDRGGRGWRAGARFVY